LLQANKFLNKSIIPMKKILGFLAVVAMTGIVACGPSAAEQKAMDEKLKKEADSIADALTKSMSAPEKSDTTKKPDAAPADTSKKK
jgi:hypothetical protein